MKYYVDNIDRYKQAISTNPNFLIKELPEYGFGVINYIVSSIETFPEIENLDHVLLRNCRGIKFDLNTGKILSLPHHKFFNLNERNECSIQNIDFSEDHYCLEKLDGSMIHPIITDDLYWCTKMGVTDVSNIAKEFILKSNSDYEGISRDLLSKNLTPIFEWCSNKNRIVVDYPEDNLILVEVRNNFTGDYISHEELESLGEKYNIPVVKRYSKISDIISYMDEVKNQTDSEGYIIKFNNKKFKIKNEWYCNRHRAVSNIVFEKDILQMIFKEEIDDIKPFLNEDIREKIENYEIKVIDGVKKFCISHWIEFMILSGLYPTKKEFSLNIDTNSDYSFLYFDLLNRKISGNSYDLQTMINRVKEYLGKVLITKTRVEYFRNWIGNSNWDGETIKIDD